LIPTLAGAKQYTALRAFLTHATDVSPSDLELCLLAALQVNPGIAKKHHLSLRANATAALAAAEAAVRDKRADVAASVARARVLVTAVEEFPAEQALLLHAVIAARRDDGAAAAAAGALTVEQVSTVLSYLDRWLRLHRAPGMVSGVEMSGAAGVPSLAHCISWAAALLDAHFSRLTMHDTGAALVKRLSSVVKDHFVTTSTLAQLDGFVRHLAERRPLPAPAGTVSALYSVERLVL
jgi:hypothetical protein